MVEIRRQQLGRAPLDVPAGKGVPAREQGDNLSPAVVRVRALDLHAVAGREGIVLPLVQPEPLAFERALPHVRLRRLLGRCVASGIALHLKDIVAAV